MESIYWEITEEQADCRLDKVISELLTEQSRTYLQKLIKEELVTVNHKSVKSNYQVSIGDCIHLNLPDAVDPNITPENIPLSILYEDKDILIVNKQKGMVVHPAPGHYTQTLVNAVMFHCQDDLSGINGIMRPGIVHRIDKDTTGSVIICKNDNAHHKIAQQLKEHTITRKYQAIVHGFIQNNTGTVDAPIGRHPRDRKKMSIQPGGKNAITHYTVLERFHKFTYIECVLETGRTHQIRVHMASLGHPILGDEVYGNLKNTFSLQGQTLHAKTIGFHHPVSEEYVVVDAPLPKYFEELLHNFRNG